MINKELERLGLSEKESVVYLACLDLGESQAPRIAQQAGIQRPITYVVLESLNKMGLVSMVDRKGKTHYIAESPINLKRLVEKQKSEIHQKEQVVKDIMPDLENTFRMMGDRPVIRFFEGIEGGESASKEILKNKVDELYAISSLDAMFEAYPAMKEDLTNKERVKKKIGSKVIYSYGGGKVQEMNNKKALREARYIPQSFLKSKADITIYGKSKVVITSLNSNRPITIVIEDPNVAMFLGEVFQLAWRGAKGL